MTILSEAGTYNESTQANRCSPGAPAKCGLRGGWSKSGGEPATVVAGGRVGGVEVGEDADHGAADEVALVSPVPVQGAEGVEQPIERRRAVAAIERDPGLR